ncbi:Acg family FMN-binding oxidoreductase [Mycolicibacterium goodii]|uniref:Acg family FMN-binding oxidoreductase n=1 Tax=Mycolicibacterium goodii TaxID=134601 RepID=UPI001BDD1FD6|nr:nitroreductase family protein [Mycolicibacterium goodii]MBU8831901.1 nitroreductase family protein [Mycolicibacterium goodii]ULN45440.1 nitroreductase family protein [Mycolicibacterium goodii]
MNAHFPGIDTIHAALALASRAPSIHNSQPWQWRVGDQSVHLYADLDRRLPSTDPDSRDLLLSCGAALHHGVVAFAALGWHAKVYRLPNPAEPEHLAAIELRGQTPTELDVAFAAAIPRRRTDRRHYSTWPVPHSDIAMMRARAARAGVMLQRIESLSRLHDIVAESIARHAADDGYLRELATWSGKYAATAGVPARSAPKPDPGAPLSARIFAGSALKQPAGSTAADEWAVVLALGTVDDTRMARLRAGEATSLVLLTATAMGLATCPVTEPLEITKTRDEIQLEVFGASGFPQMLLRVGWAPVNADPLPPTPRRRLVDVVRRLDGSPFESAAADSTD